MSLININEYANQIIFIQDYKMKGLVQIVSLMITTRNNDDFRGLNQFIRVYFYDFSLSFNVFINIHEYAN